MIENEDSKVKDKSKVNYYWDMHGRRHILRDGQVDPNAERRNRFTSFKSFHGFNPLNLKKALS